MADVDVTFAVTDQGNGFGKLEQINSELDKTKIAGQNAAEGTKAASLRFTELASAVNLAQQGLRYAEQAYEATAGKALAYAGTVRALSSVSGESAENTSRFIQVLDDWQISADDAMAATKALTKQGLAPNIETLASLSDQYLKLNSTQEKNEFILKNLGRGGLQWVRVLEQGGKALREQGRAINDNLILTQKQLDQAEDLRLAQDQLNDTYEALSISIGNKVVPALTEEIKMLNDKIRAQEILQEQGINAFFATPKQTEMAYEQAKAEREAAEATAELSKNTGDATGALDEEADSMDNLKDRAKEARDEPAKISDQNNELLDLTFKISDYNKQYAEKHAELWASVQAGEEGALDKLRALEAEYLQWQNQMIFDIVLEKLKSGVEGLSTSEAEYALNMAETLGIIDSNSRQQAESFLTIADTLTEGFKLTEEEAALAQEAIMDTKAAADELDGTTSTVTITTVHNDRYEGAGSTAPGQPFHGHAAGGSWIIPAEYGYEGYRMPGGHTASAGEQITVTPTSQITKGGTTIIINNPTSEPASDSLRGTLRTLSYLGVDV